MWVLMMSYGTPYLTSLGLSDSLTALVWLAGPLSGAIAQPIFGTLSDQCKHPWGRRRPYILGGTLCVIISLLFLACAPDLVLHCARRAGRRSDDALVRVVVQTFSVLSVYTLNVAMQPLQSGTRAIIVDTCPAHQQAQANAWVSRFSSCGNIFIYVLGFTIIPKWSAYHPGNEFQGLSIIGTLALITTVAACCLVHEKPLFSKKGYHDEDLMLTPISMMRSLWHSVRTLPPTTWRVCRIQFCAWLAWFPVLYYTTT
jgi:solute carrier family 45 protein 1/2/4